MIKAACFLLSKGGVIHQEVSQKAVGNVIKIKLLFSVLLSDTWLFSVPGVYLWGFVPVWQMGG